MPELRAIPVEGIGEVRPGADIPELILSALQARRRKLLSGDILVITHKIISKAEGQIIPLASVKPSREAVQWATKFNLDPRITQLATDDSRRIVKRGHGVTITETPHGFVCANSGVDASNVDGGHSVVLLPRDPDQSAQKLYRALKRHLGFPVPVIISDSFGRAWREGLAEVAIGLAGMRAFRDSRGARDPYGYKLKVTLEAVADELAGMAGLACGKLTRIPACIIRGYAFRPGRGRARDLIRPAERDMFR
ncbi:MAG TPA: coenzyme F420-0:L-glutamate ligase [Terriglobales bacterium]|nr:coenzyme F420-0:L-glutamate ligase [Terriglobales bacterium]